MTLSRPSSSPIWRMASRKSEAFDVADGAADFRDDDVHVRFGQGADAGFDLVGDVGDHLDGVAEVVAAAFLLEHIPIDAAGGDGGGAGGGLAGEALVVAEVEVGFHAVVGHIDFAMLVGAHGAGIDVEVGSIFSMRMRRPRAMRRRPMEAAVMPLPREETTPPVMKMYLAMMGLPGVGNGGRPGSGSRRLTFSSSLAVYRAGTSFFGGTLNSTGSRRPGRRDTCGDGRRGAACSRCRHTSTAGGRCVPGCRNRGRR
jgi:hypothetical protein